LKIGLNMTAEIGGANVEDQQQDILGESSYAEDLADHLDKVPVEIRQKWPKDLAALIDIYQATLKRMGFEDDKARRIATTLLIEQSTYGGGRYWYLPKGDRLTRAIRDWHIYRDLSQRDENGIQMDVQYLAVKYKLTLPRIYDIISVQKGLDIKRVQHSLF